MIIRRRHTANYTTIGNVLFEDERLKADEVGILAYLLSRPHDWEVRRPALMRRWDMGREAIKRVITNWVRCGWCIPCKTRLPNGTYHMIYEIRDVPGPSLSDEEVRRALSLVSSEAASDEFEVVTAPASVLVTADPPTGYPSLADPSPAEPYVANKDIQTTELPRKDSTQKPEREGARARGKHASNLLKFKQRWRTIASDDQVMIENAWWALTDDQGEAALAGIGPFEERLKRDHRQHIPSGVTYLRQRRWELIEAQQGATEGVRSQFSGNSVEGRSIATAYSLAGASAAFNAFVLRGGTVYYTRPMTPQLLKLAEAGDPETWPTLDHRQAGSWNSFLDKVVTVQTRKRLREGDRAPWPWAPRTDGTLSPTGPETLMTEQDASTFAGEGSR